MNNCLDCKKDVKYGVRCKSCSISKINRDRGHSDIEIKCLYCNIVFNVSYTERKRKYCSKKCSGHNYKPGKMSEKHKNKISETKRERYKNEKYDKSHLYGNNYGTKNKGNIFTKEHRKNIGLTSKGRKHTPETKEKIREKLISRIEKLSGTYSPNYNPEACKIIEKYGEQHNYDFQHAENGGEFKVLGYFVDGYDKNKNTVIEVLEKYHSSPKQQKRDIMRKKEIKECLGCKFIEVKLY